MKRSFFTLLLLISIHAVSAQQSSNHRLTLSALQHSTWTGVTYSYLFHPFENKNWELSFGSGFSSGLGSPGLSLLSYNAIPMFTSLSYGSTHQVGVNLGYAYKFKFIKRPFFDGLEPVEYTVFNDYNSFNYSLFYRYNFGKEDRYFLGLGGEFSHFLGKVNGSEVNLKPAFRPFLNFGFNF